MQTISEYIQNNYISKEKGMELLNLGDPDLESEVNMQTSSIRLVEKNISEMIEDNIYTRPDPHINLQQAALIAQQAYCQLVIDNAPEKGLDLLRNYIDEIQATLNPPKPPMPPPPPQGSAPLPNQIPLNAPINSPAPTLPSPSLAPVS